MAKQEEEVTSPPDPLPPLVALQRSETISKIAAALVKAQKKLKNPVKNATNPHFSSRFADLESCMDAAKAALNEQDIVLVQVFVPTGYGMVGLTTLALHASGEYIGGTATLPDDRGNAQGYGSATTYARRYGVSAILGMVAEDDDDGNAASSAPKSRKPAERPAPVGATAPKKKGGFFGS